MKLYVIRHAEAAPAEGEWVARDEDRPLTDEGRRQCHQVAAGLHHHKAAVKAIFHSPLLRARQTAAAIHDHWKGEGPSLVACEALAPGGKKRKVSQALEGLMAPEMALVGHNPDLSELVGWLLGDRRVGIDLDKSGVACLEIQGRPRKASATLLWLVTPAWLPKG